jgi:hypothetical protein
MSVDLLLAGLKGAAQWGGNCGDVQSLGFLAWQVLGARPCGTEIVQACAGLEGMAWQSGDCAVLVDLRLGRP